MGAMHAHGPAPTTVGLSAPWGRTWQARSGGRTVRRATTRRTTTARSARSRAGPKPPHPTIASPTSPHPHRPLTSPQPLLAPSPPRPLTSPPHPTHSLISSHPTPPPHLLTPPRLTSPHLTPPHPTPPHPTTPHLTSPHLTSPHLTSPHLTSPHPSSSRLASPPQPSPGPPPHPHQVASRPKLLEFQFVDGLAVRAAAAAALLSMQARALRPTRRPALHLNPRRPPAPPPPSLPPSSQGARRRARRGAPPQGQPLLDAHAELLPGVMGVATPPLVAVHGGRAVVLKAPSSLTPSCCQRVRIRDLRITAPMDRIGNTDGVNIDRSAPQAQGAQRRLWGHSRARCARESWPHPAAAAISYKLSVVVGTSSYPSVSLGTAGRPAAPPVHEGGCRPRAAAAATSWSRTCTSTTPTMASA
jgi:hypothetical protein